MIGVINYGLGNSLSVISAFEEIGIECILLDEPSKLLPSVIGLVIPGVGSFKEGINKLEESGWKDWLISNGSLNIPVLGICLGMQLLFESSEESPDVIGLGLIKGNVSRLNSGNEPVPNMGWRRISVNKINELLLDIENNSFYHVHTFGVKNISRNSIASIFFNLEKINVVVQSNKLFGVQFHPEKSLKQGLKILDNFYKICRK
tara:strand:+ start:8533 stop:9144 length:612 start_codon:yes stop_codon:yes gene_type:complete